MIFSSHVLSEVEQVCDRVVILRQGRLVHDQVMTEIRRRHRISARLTSAFPSVPENLREQLAVTPISDGKVIIDTPGELSPILGWLATLPLTEVPIEPLGLQAVYEQFLSQRGRMMSLAILAKSIRDAWLLLAALCLLIFIFAWLQIWLASMISLPDFSHFLLNAIPEKWERLSDVPFRQVATTAGRVALTFVHPVVTFTALAWAGFSRLRLRQRRNRPWNDGNSFGAADFPAVDLFHPGVYGDCR